MHVIIKVNVYDVCFASNRVIQNTICLVHRVEYG